MRVVVDFQAAQTVSRYRGIGRYSKSLLHAIIKLNEYHEVIICLNDAFEETLTPIREEFGKLVGLKNIKVWSAPGPTRAIDSTNATRRAHAETLYEMFILSLNPDIILIMSFFEGCGDEAISNTRLIKGSVPVAVVMYDFIPLHYPDAYLIPIPSWDKVYQEKLRCLASSDLLLAISNYTARDAEYLLPGLEAQVATISSACDEIFRSSGTTVGSRTDILLRLNITKKYIITSGSVEPHKNLISLFRAFAILPASIASEYIIVLIGHTDEARSAILRQMLTSVGLEHDSLVISGYVYDLELLDLYTNSALMVFPSMDEGFGLPVLEAMTCGIPVIASDRSSLPEVLGNREALFNPTDIYQIASMIKRALEDQSFRDRIIRNGTERANHFSWQTTAKSALTALESVVEAYPRNNKSAFSIERGLKVLRQVKMTTGETVELAQSLAFNHPESSRQRAMYVDVSCIFREDARTGIQRVTRSLILAWLKNPPPGLSIFLVYATEEEKGFFHATGLLERWTGKKCEEQAGRIDYASGDIFFGLDLGLGTIPHQRHFIMKMRRRGVKVLFFVYDLLPMELPHFFNDDFQALFEPWLETLLVGDGVIGISRTTVEAFKKWQQGRNILTEGNFLHEYVHLGADIKNSIPSAGLPEEAEEILSCIRGRPSFLMVGTLEPRKGHSQVLAAFDFLWDRGLEVNLIIVGKVGWRVDELIKRIQCHPECRKKLFWLDGISDEFLQAIYASSICLIAASKGEGFGLPLIEAAQAGLPVIARDIPVFREVGGHSASYFSAANADELAEFLADWFQKWQVGDIVTSEGLHWLTWEQCAQRLSDVIMSE